MFFSTAVGDLRRKINARFDQFERAETQKCQKEACACLWDIADAVMKTLCCNKRSEYLQSRFTNSCFEEQSASTYCDNVVEMISDTLKARYVRHTLM